jgi:hypothetical protein
VGGRHLDYIHRDCGFDTSMEATSAVISQNYLARSGSHLNFRINLTARTFDKHFHCQVTVFTEHFRYAPFDKQQATMICTKQRVRNRTRTVIAITVPIVSHDFTGAFLS